jgi:hypothetical protein
MKTFWIAAALVGAASTARAQEDLDARLEALVPKLAKEGPSARLAELLGTLWGREAVKERINLLVDHRAGRLDRDPQGHFEDHLFAREENGTLRVRPERKAEIARIAADVAQAHRRMDAFNRRTMELVGRIAGDGPLEKKARSWWSDSTFRIAFFNARAGELREQETAEILHELLGRHFSRSDDGKLRIAEPIHDAIQAASGRLDQIKELEKSYLKSLADAGDEVRKALVTEAAMHFVVGRLLRQADEGSPEPIGAAGEEASLAFNVPLADLVAPLRQCEALLAELKPWFEATAAALAGEQEAVEYLKNERARILVAERVLAVRQEQRARADAVFAEVLADGFEERDGKLFVKKGRYAGENQEDSPDALDAEHKGVVDGFWGGRYAFDLIAEHCADAKAAEAFGSAVGTLVLHEHMGRVCAELREKIAARGIEYLTALYLEQKGELLQVRPERAARIQDLAVRAAQLKKEAGQDP